LQELVGIFQEILELVALRSKHFGSELRGHLNSGDRRVFGNVADLIDLDAVFASESGFQLIGEGGRFCIAAGESAYESRELCLGQVRGKVDAGDSRGGQQLRKTAFSGSAAQWHAVQQDLISRRTEQ
jgi:hypothetical protein